jgi:hypothetical protein
VACAWGGATATVSHACLPGNASTGGTILGVGATVEKAQYLDLDKMAVAGFAID